MNKVTASFENQKVFVGLDIHNQSWNAAVYLNEQFISDIHKPPQVESKIILICPPDRTGRVKKSSEGEGLNK